MSATIVIVAGAVLVILGWAILQRPRRSTVTRVGDASVSGAVRGRNPRRVLLVLGCLVALVVLFYAGENWRGQHTWKKFKTEWEAKGNRFELASLAPPPVPDDQNSAMTPIWVDTIGERMGAEKARTWYGDKVDAPGHTNFVGWLNYMPFWYYYGHSEDWHLQFTHVFGTWEKGEKFDLKPLQEYYRSVAAFTNFFPVASQSQPPADDVLLALSRYDSTIEELRRASRLPYSRFPICYHDANPSVISLPHLASLKHCAQTLQLRAVAELQSGQTEKALDDLKLMLRLTESVRPEPFLNSHLVRAALLSLMLQPVWEGLADHQWTDAQLAALDAELGRLDFLADYHFTTQGELTAGAGTIDYLRRSGKAPEIDYVLSKSAAEDPDFESGIWLARFGPSGWLEQNKVACSRAAFDLLMPIVNLETRTVSAAAAAKATKAVNEMGRTRYNWFARFWLSGNAGNWKKFACAQWSVDAARIACALERYRLANGNYPDTLDLLAPQFLKVVPHDLINGQPLNYRRLDAGRFLLYSVGWNETDDGGKIVFKEKDRWVDRDQGDWVWRYPAK